MTISDENLMLDALRAAEQIARIVWTKQLAVLTAGADETFLTSDHPGAFVHTRDTPAFFSAGFLMSDVAFPIGRKALLYWVNEDKKRPAQTPTDVVSQFERSPRCWTPRTTVMMATTTNPRPKKSAVLANGPRELTLPSVVRSRVRA